MTTNRLLRVQGRLAVARFAVGAAAALAAAGIIAESRPSHPHATTAGRSWLPSCREFHAIDTFSEAFGLVESSRSDNGPAFTRADATDVLETRRNELAALGARAPEPVGWAIAGYADELTKFLNSQADSGDVGQAEQTVLIFCPS